MRWRLMYAPTVISYLYSLRLAGHALRQEIQAIAEEAEPWLEDLAIENRTNRYERLIRGHWVGYEVDREDKTLRVIYIQAL